MVCVSRARKAVGLTCVLALAAVSASAAINLEWRPLSQTANLGDPVGVGLYAVSDSNQGQVFNSAQVIMTWDPAYLLLTGVDQTGSVGLMVSAFTPNDSFGFNESNPPTDGDGIWFGFVQFGETRTATPQGSLLTTVMFNALALTPGTPVTMHEDGQKPSRPPAETWVISGTYNVLGTLSGPAIVQIVPALTRGDLNCDGVINAFDIDPFVLALTDPAGYAAAFPGCNILNADIDCDGAVGPFDIDPFVQCLTVGCPPCP
jgi:hypothetical protein